MPISLGKAAQDLRSRLSLSLRQAAAELGVSYVHLCNVENGKRRRRRKCLKSFMMHGA